MKINVSYSTVKGDFEKTIEGPVETAVGEFSMLMEDVAILSYSVEMTQEEQREILWFSAIRFENVKEEYEYDTVAA